MFMPGFFGESLFDEFFDDFVPDGRERQLSKGARFPQQAMPSAQPMRTDVRETASGYELAVELPGVRKEDISVELKDGCLTIRAVTGTENEQKNADGSFIRRERFVGTRSRSFYVGEEVTEDEIKARYEDGVLRLSVPKKEARPAAELRRYIPIEG